MASYLPLNVLVVEDDPDSAYVISQLIKASGCRVLACRDGHEALAQTRYFTPDVVFLDIGLPSGMDGFEVGRRLRDRFGPAPRLHALTGMQRSLALERALVCGFNDVLPKPLQLSRLYEVLGRGP